MTANRPSKPATAARIYDYFLGGTHNFPADCEAANNILAMFPATRMATQVNRAFLRRTVRFLGRAGITQFLDIGSGIPTEGNVHEIAQEAVPDARVVYVDIDPVAVAESQEMLEHNEFAMAVYGDARDPRSIVDHPTVRKVLDFDKPVAVLMVALLHFVADDDEARTIVRQLLDVVPSGSYLVISHVIDETAPDYVQSGDVRRVHEVYRKQTATILRLRTRPEIERYFEGLELVEPGLVWLTDWRQEPDDPIPAEDDVAYYVAAGGVGRKP
ncbi:MAG TPA: SAM-dependent methyltransferase [Candidatus Limnocylindrales bacterium]|nr:SAM-dependent methyltransferase [Candidatus Limnocylindrales bacterium]